MTRAMPIPSPALAPDERPPCWFWLFEVGFCDVVAGLLPDGNVVDWPGRLEEAFEEAPDGADVRLLLLEDVEVLLLLGGTLPTASYVFASVPGWSIYSHTTLFPELDWKNQK
jgi:hypothetical protein